MSKPLTGELREVVARHLQDRPRTAIVSASELSSTCWSARRFTGRCAECPCLGNCKLPEADAARLDLARCKLILARERVVAERQKVRELRREIEAMEEHE